MITQEKNDLAEILYLALDEMRENEEARFGEISDSGIALATTVERFATERLNSILEEVAENCRVGGAYWSLLARPVFASAIYAVYDRIVDYFDDEDLYNQSAYFLLRAIFKIHSDEIEKPSEE